VFEEADDAEITKLLYLGEVRSKGCVKEVKNVVAVFQKPDSSSLYHSFVHVMKKNSIGAVNLRSANALRRHLAKLIDTNERTSFKQGITFRTWIYWSEETSTREYMRKMQNENNCGGALEIFLFARVFNVNICVYQERGRQFFALAHYKGGKSVEVVHLLYTSGNHYEALVPKDDNPLPPPPKSPVFLVSPGLDGFNLKKNDERLKIDIDNFYVETNNLGGLLQVVGTKSITLTPINDGDNKCDLGFTVSKDSRLSWIVAMHKDKIPKEYYSADKKEGIRIETRKLVVKLFNKALRMAGDTAFVAEYDYPNSTALVRIAKALTLSPPFLEKLGRSLRDNDFKCIFKQYGQKAEISNTDEWLPQLIHDADKVELDFGFRLMSNSFPEHKEPFAPLVRWKQGADKNYKRETQTDLFELFPMAQHSKNHAGWMSSLRPENVRLRPMRGLDSTITREGLWNIHSGVGWVAYKFFVSCNPPHSGMFMISYVRPNIGTYV